MSWQKAIDISLELPVVTSFTNLGYLVRRRLFDWPSLDSYQLGGLTIMITGATSGIGLAAADQLARAGADLVIIGRSSAKTAEVCKQLTDRHGNRNSYLVADTGDFEAVRAAAALFLTDHDRLDVLIHNAGALSSERRIARDGTEATLASQVLGPFLLTSLLVEALAAAAPAKVLWMSSGGMYAQPLSVDHLEMGPDDYQGSVAYAKAKRAQVTLAQMWAERLRDTGVVVHALHPGWVDTPGVAVGLPMFHRVVGPLLRSPEQGADTLVWLASDDGEPAGTSGRFWHDRRTRPIHRLRSTRSSDTPTERQRLWDTCVERTASREVTGERAPGT